MAAQFSIERWLDKCTLEDDLTTADREELRNLLTMTCLKKVARLIVQEMNGSLMQLSTMDLNQNMSDAVRQQGRLAGLRRFFDVIEEEINHAAGNGTSEQQLDN